MNPPTRSPAVAGSGPASAVVGIDASPEGEGASGTSSLIADLFVSPFEFDFDAAVAILLRAKRVSGPADAVRFEAAAGLGFAPSDVLAVRRHEDDTFQLVNGLIGLTGPAGALPRIYSEHVITERRERSRVLADFLDLLAQRPIAYFAAAALKYRPHRIAEVTVLDNEREDALRATLMALTGHSIPVVSRALGDDLDTVLHHAGAFATHPRSADRLSAILSNWLGRTVTVEQFVGRWIRLDPSERSTLPGVGKAGRFTRLGIDVAVGAAYWDIQSTIVIRIGPLPIREFDALLPGAANSKTLVDLARTYLNGAADFRVNPVLAAADIPPLVLGAGRSRAARLGWNAWLGAGSPREHDGTEAVFSHGLRGRS